MILQRIFTIASVDLRRNAIGMQRHRCLTASVNGVDFWKSDLSLIRMNHSDFLPSIVKEIENG